MATRYCRSLTVASVIVLIFYGSPVHCFALPKSTTLATTDTVILYTDVKHAEILPNTTLKEKVEENHAEKDQVTINEQIKHEKSNESKKKLKESVLQTVVPNQTISSTEKTNDSVKNPSKVDNTQHNNVTTIESSATHSQYELNADITTPNNSSAQLTVTKSILNKIPSDVTRNVTDLQIKDEESNKSKNKLKESAGQTGVPNHSLSSTEKSTDSVNDTSRVVEKTQNNNLTTIIDFPIPAKRSFAVTDVTDANVRMLPAKGGSKTSDIINDKTYFSATSLSDEIDKSFNKNETTKINTTVIVKPSWKKYTVIERKKPPVNEFTVNTEQNKSISKEITMLTSLEKHIENSNDIVKANLSQARDPLEKAESVTSAVTLLNKLTTQATKSEEITASSVFTNNSSTESTVSETSESKDSTKRMVVETKRGGFLDHSGSVSAKLTNITTSTDSNMDTASIAKLEEFKFDVVGLTTSQSSAVNDITPLTIGDSSEPVYKSYTSGQPKSQEKSKLESTTPDSTITTIFTERKLGVKPISQEKSRGSMLYTVSPNYKPLKKFDVQPAKPFVRDPDDNTWRNESLSSLGIVFNAKNSSKPFTQVLKNKTETELNTLQDKENKSDLPELKIRLEKIAELRKSKKNRTDKFGVTHYGDYDEKIPSDIIDYTRGSSGDSVPVSYSDVFSPMESLTTTNHTPSNPTSIHTTVNPAHALDWEKRIRSKEMLRYSQIKVYSGEDDADYVHDIDLKKKTTPIPTTKASHQFPERKPTVQYFPPLITPKTEKKEKNTKIYETQSVKQKNTSEEKFNRLNESKTPHNYNINNKKTNPYKTSTFLTHPPVIAEHTNGYSIVNHEGEFNRASYVIKHYNDFVAQAIRDSNFDKTSEFISTFTQATPVGKSKVNNFDFDPQFHKEVIDKLVDIKSDFPTLYNSSIVHKKAENSGKVVASSRNFMKILYNDKSKSDETNSQTNVYPKCNPQATVELTPDYELHYYVPEQEERQEVDSKLSEIKDVYKGKYIF